MKKVGAYIYEFLPIFFLLLLFGILVLCNLPNKDDMQSNTSEISAPVEASEALPTPSLTPMPTTEPTPQPTVSPSPESEVYVPYTPSIDVSKCTDDELIAIADELVFRIGPWPDGYNAVRDPEVSIDTDNPTEIAKEYANLLGSDKWTGFTTSYKDFEVSTSYGEIEINGELTGIKTNERIYYDIAKELYIRGV